ncbi:15838_t:CDS:2, partial [Racocetra persica]
NECKAIWEVLIGKIEEIIAKYESREYLHNTISVPSIQHNHRKNLKQSHKNEDRTECYYVKRETVEQEGSSRSNDET